MKVPLIIWLWYGFLFGCFFATQNAIGQKKTPKFSQCPICGQWYVSRTVNRPAGGWLILQDSFDKNPWTKHPFRIILPKFNMEPKSEGFQKLGISFSRVAIHFSGSMLNFGRVWWNTVFYPGPNIPYENPPLSSRPELSSRSVSSQNPRAPSPSTARVEPGSPKTRELRMANANGK